MAFKDYYKILELELNATADEIKTAYRQLAKRYHPDSNGGNYNFTELMQDINEAQEVLQDINKRFKYDLTYKAEKQKREAEQKAREEAEKRKNPLKDGELVWCGKYFQDFNIDSKRYNILSFEIFAKNIFEKYKIAELKKANVEKEQIYFNKTFVFRDFVPPVKRVVDIPPKIENLQPKGEFEKTVDFEIRKAVWEKNKNELELKYKNELNSANIEFDENLKSQKDKYETDKNIELTKFNSEKYMFESSYIQKREKVIKNLDIWLKNNRSEMFNNFLGSQTVSMIYNADIEEFAVSVESQHEIIFKFNIFVPQFVAQEFKNSVKNFRFSFVKQADKFILENINVLFQDKEFFAKDFDKNIFTEIERLHKEQRIKRIRKIKYFLISIISIVPILFLIDSWQEAEEKAQAEPERERKVKIDTFTIDALMFQDGNQPEEMNWKNAVAYCENLKHAGFSNWRLPNKEELQEAYNNKSKFKNIEKYGWYWSSTIRENYSSNTWFVGFDDGTGNWSDQTYNDLVLCVRDL